jgi:hypothetical protein
MRRYSVPPHLSVVDAAALVAWTVNYLCQNPEAERKLAEEVALVLGPPPRARADGGAAAAVRPSWQQLNEMRYMTCVLKETLRLRPPGGWVGGLISKSPWTESRSVSLHHVKSCESRGTRGTLHGCSVLGGCQVVKLCVWQLQLA